MNTKTASIIGATGMIGDLLLGQLLNDEYFSTVRVIVRRPIEKTHSKMEIKLVDFSDPESFKLALEGTDIIFCCIGTTQKSVKGNKELYRQIDYEIPVNTARFGKETGCTKFIIVSSVGASPKSKNFYLKLKGELEEAIRNSGIESIHIMQPSMLLGKRNEKRRGEKFIQGFTNAISKLFFGSLRKYKSIQGKTVAEAMLNVAKMEKPGFFKHTHDEIMKLATTSPDS